MDNLTEQELKAVFDVVNVFEPKDISHVYPEMATEEFMMDVLSAWKKILKNLDTIKQNWENIIMIKTEVVDTKHISRPTGSYTEFEKLQWVCDKPIPAVGSEVEVKINGIGRSIVLKYFVEHGFIGLLVPPQDPPAWYIKQNGADEPCHVFPAEVAELQVRKDDGKPNEEFYNEALQPV